MIKTADCVKAIQKHFYEMEADNIEQIKGKNWKRISKKGTGDNIVRVFENRVTGDTMIVNSTETVITRVYKGRPVDKTPPEPVLNLTGERQSIKDILRRAVANNPNRFHELAYELFGEDKVVNWPIVTLPRYEGDDGEEDREPLDMENFEWISVTNTELVIACGGDWQEPYTLTIRLVNGRLTVVNSEPGYPEGMDYEEFLRLIN